MPDMPPGPDRPDHDPELTAALLRVVTAVYRSGFTSGLATAGLPIPLAHHLAGHAVESLTEDPAPRNAAMDVALAAFHDTTPPDSVSIPMHIRGCGGRS